MAFPSERTPIRFWSRVCKDRRLPIIHTSDSQDKSRERNFDTCDLPFRSLEDDISHGLEILISIWVGNNAKSEVDNAAHEAATSVQNDLQEPTSAQIEAKAPKQKHAWDNLTADQKSETLIKVVNERNKVQNMSSLAKEEDKISSSVKSLFAVAENYPDLKANKLFQNLQVELVGTEDKIAFARQFYNDCVQKYNTAIMMFPTNIFAKLLKYDKKEYFKEYYSGSEDLLKEDIQDLVDFAKLLEDKAEELKFDKTASFQESDSWVKP